MSPSSSKKRSTLVRKAARSYRSLALILLNTLVLLMGLEWGARAILRSEPFFWYADPNAVFDPTTLSYYQAQAWTADYWRELSRYRMRYRPYVGWRGASLESTTINIDEQGLRRTPEAGCTPQAYTVFMFGGSTLWGDGAPDWGTIPAYLQQSLQAVGEDPVCVVNFGEVGFVSTQNLIRLITQLQVGHVPDLVIFYDGANEVYAAYQSGQAGSHINLQSITEKFERREHPLLTFLKGKALFKLAQGLVAKQKPTTYQTMGLPSGDLAETVVQIYLKNYEMVAVLAQHYGFDYVFFWQPALVSGQKPLTVEEQAIKDAMEPALVLLFETTYQRLEHAVAAHLRLHDLSHVLDEQTVQIWFDPVHITPEGNALVAQAMLGVLARQRSGE